MAAFTIVYVDVILQALRRPIMQLSGGFLSSLLKDIHPLIADEGHRPIATKPAGVAHGLYQNPVR